MIQPMNSPAAGGACLDRALPRAAGLQATPAGREAVCQRPRGGGAGSGAGAAGGAAQKVL
jgi:hypothetical protein